VARPVAAQSVPTAPQHAVKTSRSPEPTDSTFAAKPSADTARQPQVAVSASEPPQSADRQPVEPQRANPFEVQPSQSESAEDRISPVSQSKQEDAHSTSFQLAPTTRQLRPSSKLDAFDVELLDQWAEAPEKYIDPLIRLLKNSEPEKRCYAVFLLGRAGKGASQALPDLRRELRIETGAMARVRIAESIYRIHGPDDASLKELLDQLKNGEVNIRCTAARVLAIAQDSPRLRFVIENLADSLRDEDTTVGRAAAYTLATFGENSRLVLPDLFDAAKSIDPNLRAAARTAISKIDPDLVLPEEEK